MLKWRRLAVCMVLGALTCVATCWVLSATSFSATRNRYEMGCAAKPGSIARVIRVTWSTGRTLNWQIERIQPNTPLGKTRQSAVANIRTLGAAKCDEWLVAEFVKTDPELVFSRIDELAEGSPPVWATPPTDALDFSAIQADVGWPYPAMFCRMFIFTPAVGRNIVRTSQYAFRPKGLESTALPLAPLWTGMLLNTFLFGAAWWTGWASIRWAYRSSRLAKGRCPACGYSRAGLTRDLCPECGAVSC